MVLVTIGALVFKYILFSVTAAHCIKHYKKEEMSVKLGEYDFNKKGEGFKLA